MLSIPSAVAHGPFEATLEKWDELLNNGQAGSRYRRLGCACFDRADGPHQKNSLSLRISLPSPSTRISRLQNHLAEIWRPTNDWCWMP